MENLVLEGIQSVEKASHLPEIQCSHDNIPESNCIDLYKLEHFSASLDENNIFYFPIFGYSRITLNQVFPDSDLSFVVYDRPLDDFSSIQSTHIPISIFDPAEQEYSFGIFKVEVFS